MVATHADPAPAAPTSVNVHWSWHAVERFREHEPNATHVDALRSWDAGEAISAELAHALVSQLTVRPGSVYRVAPARSGNDRLPWVMVTYLWLGLEQVRLVESWRRVPS